MSAREHLGIYVSVPFCASKCTYCNFASGVFAKERMAAYVARLVQEIEGARANAAAIGAELPTEVNTIYFGGGTPSLLPPELFLEIANALLRAFALTTDCEWTVECAPGQLSAETLAAMRAGGVNRISFGAQSFVHRETAASGRLHTPEQTIAAVEQVRSADISNINVDLIAGLPHQTRASFEHSLQSLLALDVPHASVYMLEVDEDSRLGRELLGGGSRYGAANVPSDEDIVAMYQEACRAMQRAGLQQYEISNFAHVGRESRHNFRYWQRRPYLGFGVDAHSMLRTARGEAVRFASADSLDAYQQGIEQPVHMLTAREDIEEEFFLGLRTAGGVDLTELEQSYGWSAVAPYRETIATLTADGLIERNEHSCRLTPRGILFSNEVFARFLEEPALA